MFGPNSLKTLIDMKIHKDLESTSNEKQLKNDSSLDMESSFDGMRISNSSLDLISKDSSNPINCLLNVKNLIRDVEDSIVNVRKWRIDENKMLEDHMKMNKINREKKLQSEICKIIRNENEYFEAEEQYEEEIRRIESAFKSDYHHSYLPKAFESYMSSEYKTNEVSQKLEESYKKLDELKIDKFLEEMQAKDLTFNPKDLSLKLEENFDKFSINTSLPPILQIGLEPIEKNLTSGIWTPNLPAGNPQEEDAKISNQSLSHPAPDIKQDLQDIEKELQELEALFSKK